MAMFAVQVGFGFTVPYMAIYLDREFHVHDPSRLAFLTGLAIGSVGLSASIVGPIWGMVGDRYGRRPMFVRAMFGVALMIGAGGLAPNVATLIATRFAMGLGSGINPGGMAIVAEGTPGSELPRALGITVSARSLGQALGPVLGALLASFLPLRAVFVAAGVLMLFVATPVALVVKDPAPPKARRRQVSIRQAVHAKGRNGWRTLAVLVLCLGLVFYSVGGLQQLIVLRILQMHVTAAAIASGSTFTIFGIATALASIFYSRATSMVGFRPVCAGSAALFASAIVTAAFAPNVLLLVICSAASGLTCGALLPTLNSMLGLEAPADVRATIFGFAGSATSLGVGAGPLVSGTFAALFGLVSALLSVAAVTLVTGVLILAWGREPPLAPQTAEQGY